MKRPYPYTGQGAQAPAAQQPQQAAPAAAYSNYGYGGAMGSAAPGYGQPIAPAPPAAQPQPAASTSHDAQQRQWHQQWQEYYAKQAAQAGTQAAPQQQAQPRPAAQAQPYQPYGAAFPQSPAPHQAAHQQQQPPTFGVQSPFPQAQGPAPGPMPHSFQPQAQPQQQPQQPYGGAPLAPAWNAPQPTQQQPPPRPFYNQPSQSQFPQAAPPAKRPRFEPPSSYGSPQGQNFQQPQHPLPAPPHAATQGRPPPQQSLYGSDAGPAAQNSFGWNSPNAQRGSAMPPQQQSFRGGRGGNRGGMAGGPVAPHAPVPPIQNPNAGNPLLAGVNSTPPAIRAGRGAFGASRGGAHGGRGGSHAADLGDRSGRAGRSGRTGFGATPKFAPTPSAPSGPGSGSRSGGAHGRAGRSGASASSQSAAFEQAHRGQPVVSAMSARLALGLDDAAVLSTKNKKQYFADFNFASIEISGLDWKWSAEKSDGEGAIDPAADGTESPDTKIAGEGAATDTAKPVASPSPPGRLRITFASAPSNTGPPGAPSGPSADVKKGSGPDVNGKVASTDEEVAEASDWSPFSKGQHQPSNNRIALLYGPPTLQRRLAIDAEIVKEVRVFREEARWEMEVRIQTQPRVQPPDKDGKRTREWVVARGVSIETREGDDNFIAVTRPQLERAWTTKSNITSLTTVDKGADKKEKRPNGLPGKPSAAVTGQSSSTNDDADAEVQADVAEKTEGSGEGGVADSVEADADAKKAELSELKDDREPPIPGLYSDLPPLHHLLEHSDSEAGGQRTLIISVSLASLQSEEPAWLQTGLVDDWLSKLPGYRRAPEMQPWIGKVRIMDPNPSPSIEDVLTDWATSSTVGFGRDRRNFVKDHFGTSRALAEVFAKLCLWRSEKGGGDAKGGNGAAAVSTTGAGPTLQSFKELGVPLSLPALSQPSPFAAPDSSAAGKMSHLGFAALSLFGLASQYATQAGVEDETLREQMALLLMMVPETALHRAVDLIYRDYLASHPAPKKSGDASSSLSGASAVGAAYASGARRGSIESSVAGGDLEVAATVEAATSAAVKDEAADGDASASRQVEIEVGDEGSPATVKVEAKDTGADGAEAIGAERTVKDEEANLDEAVAPEESPPLGARGLPSSQTAPSPGGDLEEDDETMQEGGAQHAIDVEEPEDSDRLDPGMDVDESEHRDQDAASVKTPEISSDFFELEEDAEGEEE